jgi:hypothetical protein
MPQDCMCGHAGGLTDFERPAWEPLVAAVGERLAATFMWMQSEALAGGLALHAYKHRHTRRYLYLTEDGRAFERAPCGGYVPLRLDFAIERALCSWWILSGWQPEDAVAIRDAVVRANHLAGGTISSRGD